MALPLVHRHIFCVHFLETGESYPAVVGFLWVFGSTAGFIGLLRYNPFVGQDIALEPLIVQHSFKEELYRQLAGNHLVAWKAHPLNEEKIIKEILGKVCDRQLIIGFAVFTFP